MEIKNKSFICLLAGIAAFFILKVFEMQFKFSDGYTYMYMGKLILNGLVPYKDFFFASPPFQIYFLSFFEIFFGKNIILLKFIPIVAVIGSSIFIYLFMKKKFGEWQGLTASLLFLFSFLVLLTTDYLTGISVTTFFILGMAYFIEEDKPFVAGVFGSLALLTRLYSPFPIAGALVYYIIYKRKEILKFVIGLLSLFLPVSIFFQIISNGNYLSQIFFFRLNLISGIGLSKLSVVWFFLVGDFVLILGSLFWLLFDKEKKKLTLPVLMTFVSIIFYVVYSDIYYLYFGLIIGFLSMFSAKFLFEFSDFKNFKKVLVALLVILILFNSFLYIQNHASSANITFTNDIVNFVKNNSNSSDTIYGSFELTPLIGILSERKLAGNIADTNPKNIMISAYNLQDLEKKIAGVKFIISKVNILPDGEIADFDASTPLDYINKNCNLTKTYNIEKDYSSNAVVIFECK